MDNTEVNKVVLTFCRLDYVGEHSLIGMHELMSNTLSTETLVASGGNTVDRINNVDH